MKSSPMLIMIWGQMNNKEKGFFLFSSVNVVTMVLKLTAD